MKIPVCDNCGSSEINEKWVSKRTKRSPPEDVSFDDWGEKLITDKKTPLSDSAGDILYLGWGDSISNYCQLAISCKDCGFTKVYDV